MRVTNWQRWNRTKALIAGISWLVAVGAIGGTESDPDANTPLIPYPGVALVATTLLIVVIWSFIRPRNC